MGGIAEIIGAVLIATGAFFFVTGAIGLYRMPDVFTRMHAAGISDTVGAGLLLVGMMFYAGFSLVAVKLLIILGIVIFTTPVATHALAQAALHAGVQPVLRTKDILGEPPAEREPRRAAPPAKPAAAKRQNSRRPPPHRRGGARIGRGAPSSKR